MFDLATLIEVEPLEKEADDASTVVRLRFFSPLALATTFLPSVTHSLDLIFSFPSLLILLLPAEDEDAMVEGFVEKMSSISDTPPSPPTPDVVVVVEEEEEEKVDLNFLPISFLFWPFCFSRDDTNGKDDVL